MITEAPLLETERLRLRGFMRSDFEAVYQMGTDAEMTRHKGGPILSRALAWEKFLRGPAMWPMLGYGMWIAERREDGAVLGQIGYADFMREMEPPLADVPEMAWVLGRASQAPDGRGLGFGTEALRATLAWGDANLAAEKVQCIITPDNIPSLKLARKFDFTELRQAPYKGDDVIVLERLRPQ